MLIKFKNTDPRAGSIVRMDSSRGQQFIDCGAAEQVTESGVAAQPEQDVVMAEVTATKPKAAKGKK